MPYSPVLRQLSAAAVACVFVGAFSQVARAQLFSDDFTSGNDQAWTRYAPRPDSQFNAFGGLYTIGAGPYQPPPGPGRPPTVAQYEAVFGLARAGSFVTGVVASDFNLRVNVFAPSQYNQFVGVAGRVSGIGPGSTSGYVLGVDLASSTASISRLTGEVSQGPLGPLASVKLADPSGNYRLEFIAEGSHLSGKVFSYSGELLASLSGEDSTLATGSVGILTSTPLSGGMTVASFAQFSLQPVPEPASCTAIAGLALVGCAAVRRLKGKPQA